MKVELDEFRIPFIKCNSRMGNGQMIYTAPWAPRQKRGFGLSPRFYRARVHIKTSGRFRSDLAADLGLYNETDRSLCADWMNEHAGDSERAWTAQVNVNSFYPAFSLYFRDENAAVAFFLTWGDEDEN